jgi:hypothetical protein
MPAAVIGAVAAATGAVVAVTAVAAVIGKPPSHSRRGAVQPLRMDARALPRVTLMAPPVRSISSFGERIGPRTKIQNSRIHNSKIKEINDSRSQNRNPRRPDSISAPALCEPAPLDPVASDVPILIVDS